MKTVRITYLTMRNGKQGEACLETQMNEEYVHWMKLSMQYGVAQHVAIEHLLEAHEQVCGRTYVKCSVYDFKVLEES